VLRVIFLLVVAAGLSRAVTLPLVFEANRGQENPEVRYLAHSPQGIVWLTGRDAVLGTPSGSLEIGFDGGNRSPRIQPEDSLPGEANYFIGDDPLQWRRQIPLFGKVRYQAVWPGIDVVFYGNPQDLEFDLAVAEGADPGRIGLRYGGASKISLDPSSGDLLISVGRKVIRQHAPRIYQGKKTVSGRYVLTGRNRVKFQVDAFDKSKPLVIDPVLTFATFWGGGQYDAARAVAMDAQGNVVIAGQTYSGGYPTVNSHYSNANLAGASAFIAKFNPAGATPGASIIFSTYFGGVSSYSLGEALALDSSGNIYLTGLTDATDLPVSSNAYQRAPLTNLCEIFNVGKQQQETCGTGFVSKFSPGADQLLYSTYLGGENLDYPLALAVDAQGNAYVGGQTYSKSFPANQGFQNQLMGTSDGFLSKLSPDGSQVMYSTYFGGANNDWITGIAVGPSGLAYVGGVTYSTQLPLASSGAYSSSLQGPNTDGFLAKFDTTKSGQPSLLYSTYIGGKGGDTSVNGVAADSAGNIFATGQTASLVFPVTSNAFQTTLGSAAIDNGAGNTSTDAFVLKLNPSAQGAAQLLYSSFLGGEYGDTGNAITLDSTGKILVVGSTNSDNFPETPDAFNCCYTVQPSINGTVPNKGFLARIDPTQPGAAGLLYSTLVGGNNGDDELYALSVSSNGHIVAVAGTIGSTDVPVSAAAYQSHSDAQGVAYVGLFDLTQTGPAITNATNAANFQPQSFSPGMIFSIFGHGLGPQMGLGPELDSNGRVSTNVGGTQVLVGGYAAPILYASDTQVNAVVPYELDPTKIIGGTFIQAIYNGVSGSLRQVVILPAAPGIFVISPDGQGAILNQDGSMNGSGNPAAKGSYIQIYATGEGQTNPPGIDGHIAVESVANLARPVAPVSVSIGGVTVASSDIAYAGTAPQGVAGFFQITVKVPSNIPSGPNAVVITIGTGNNAVSSQKGVTVAVQ
jgi:uncharacterized protein (TIGR03437 family)